MLVLTIDVPTVVSVYPQLMEDALNTRVPVVDVLLDHSVKTVRIYSGVTKKFCPSATEVAFPIT